MNKVRYGIKQYIKQFGQKDIFPLIYDRYVRETDVTPGKVIIADMHETRPDLNLLSVGIELRRMGYDVRNMCVDIGRYKPQDQFRYIKTFMKEYAGAQYVFISSYFIPASACRRRPETKLINLWHACGAYKKFGYDAGEDIPDYVSVSPAGNVDFLTVSSEACAAVYDNALRLPEGTSLPTGIARTDLYYSDNFNQLAAEKFLKKHPNAAGRNVCLYAPTFTGNASDPLCPSFSPEMKEAMEGAADFYFAIRLHPHFDKIYNGPVKGANWEVIRDMRTEELFSPADVMVTDYSSVLFDFMLYNKPVVIYTGALGNGAYKRGFYTSRNEMPFKEADSLKDLMDMLTEGDFRMDAAKANAFKEKYLGACDGRSVERIIEAAGIKRPGSEI